MRIAQSLHLLTVEYVAQTACLFFRIGKYIQLVALKQIVFERLCKQLEILMEQRLGRHVERYGGLRSARRLCAELYRAETAYLLTESCRRNEIVLLAHIAYYLLLLHLGGTLQTFCQCLVGESVVVYLLYRRAQIQSVFHHEQRVVGQHCCERLFLFGSLSQFGHDADALLRVLRQLVCHFKRAYCVHLIAKEVDAERQFRRVAIYVDYTATHGKLTGFVDIVNLSKTEITQLTS